MTVASIIDISVTFSEYMNSGYYWFVALTKFAAI